MAVRLGGRKHRKPVRFTVSLTAAVDERLQKMADDAGQPKSTMAAICLAAGLSVFESGKGKQTVFARAVEGVHKVIQQDELAAA